MNNTSKQLKQISNKHITSEEFQKKVNENHIEIIHDNDSEEFRKKCDKNLIKLKKDLNRQFDHVSTHLFRSEHELSLLRKEIKCLREEYNLYREPSSLVVVFYDKLHDLFDSLPTLQEIDELTKLNKTSTELLNSYRERI